MIIIKATIDQRLYLAFLCTQCRYVIRKCKRRMGYVRISTDCLKVRSKCEPVKWGGDKILKMPYFISYPFLCILLPIKCNCEYLHCLNHRETKDYITNVTNHRESKKFKQAIVFHGAITQQ